MRVIVHVVKHYDWAPVPEDVSKDEIKKGIAEGKVRPAANGGHLMRVTRDRETHTLACITEATIIARIIHEMMPNQGCRQVTRKEAMGQVMAVNIMPQHAHPSHMRRFEVEDDGPNEALFREMIQPYTTAPHASGEMLIPPSAVESMVAKYLAPATNDDHVNHLHDRLSVPKKAVS